MAKVVIFQYRLLHYRTELFDLLREACGHRGITLHLIHGQPTRREAARHDQGNLPWAQRVRNFYLPVGRRDVVWQPFPREHRDARLVVVMQENRLLSNYPLLLLPRRQQMRLAYWGHGRNFQSPRPEGFLERWKTTLVGRVDWWFAYTQATRRILLTDGYPDERITVLDNAIDSQAFQKDLGSFGAEDLALIRKDIGAGSGTMIGLFCGSLYPDKRLDYLITAGDYIHERLEDFVLVVVGDGPSGAEVRSAAVSRPWLRWVGARKGREKAGYFRVASVVLNPGAVGLHVLDAFCAGIPMVTTEDARHGPEIAYLKNGQNGLVVAGGPERYADVVIELLRSPAVQEHLREGSRQAAEAYTLPNMVQNFADGIERCLAMPRKEQ
ncbi:MAG: glycosyltransferase family 4 protein [Candidatus Accumulibacter sp.]|uniref:glycosyltransferase family 4 protein n=1 Tax=Accumulibacter sp. TaxID=2053492 RepID=UPI00258B824F|nr:glycosyltransferase family 4 protein [Accumulibacter sp.]MCM8622179.1 glycosyltransferase family 4 protein [Accumulibacter sp.]